MVRRQRRPRKRRNRGVLEKVGAGLGVLLNKGLSTLITGFGDYKVNENTLMLGGLDPPSVINSISSGGVIVRHREYLQDIAATIVFTLQAFPLNPGIISTFPWLSNVAQHFEQYRMRGVLFEFKTLSSDTVLSSATSSALGSVIMATQYNALLPPFPDKFTMENYQFANSSKPSNSFLHPVECMRGQSSISELYVRDGAPPAGSDLRLFDLGTFYIATVGMQAASGVAGELWVTYEIELYKPKIPNPIGASLLMDHFKLSSSATNANPFTGAIVGTANTIGGSIPSVNLHTYAFPSTVPDGRFLLMWYLKGNSTAITPSTLTLVNCVGVNIFDGDSASQITSTGTTTTYFDMACVDLVGDTFNIFVGYGTSGVYPAVPTFGDLFVIGIPGNATAADIVDVLPNDLEAPEEVLISLLRNLLSK
jgi:hypothetical protein